MKKNQERRLHRKNAKIVKEGGAPMQLNRPIKPETTVCLLMKRFARSCATDTRVKYSGGVGIVERWVT
jgi:hypothetical protein